MEKHVFFTYLSMIANKYGCQIDIDFDTKTINFRGLENDPVKQLQMVCELESSLGEDTVCPNTNNGQKEVYLGAVKITLE